MLRLVTVGRLSQGKNTAAAIEALPAILQEIEQVSLDVVGSGEMMIELKTLAEQLDLSERVHFHGNLPHQKVLETLSNSHLFLFPTRVKEGFPKALLEAMACGLPCIATRVSVIPQLLGEGTGVLLGQPNHQPQARSLLDLTADPDNMATMGANARKAAREYTLEAWRDTIRARLETHWGPLKSPVG
jgi:colanic acid/amylovoran biosynthesis glycosyltransferase